MKKIISEYLQILNDYIKVEEKKGVKHYKVTAPEELSIVLECFWTIEYDKIIEKIKTFNGLKTMHFGFIPSNPDEYIKRSSLYSDLIIFSAPVDSLMIKPLLDNEKELDRLFRIASGKLLKINKIKDWIDEGFVTFVPDHTNQRIMQKDLHYVNTIKPIIDDDRGDNSLKKIIDDLYIRTLEEDPSYNIGLSHNLESTKQLLYSAGAQDVNNILIQSGNLNAILTAFSDYNWEILIYKFKKDQKLIGKDSFSFAALNKVNVKFLDNVTLDFARKIRKEGYLSEFRSYFRETFAEIQKTPDESEFYDIVNNYSIEIFDQVKMHEREWENIKKEAVEKCGIKGSFALSAGTIGGMASFGLGIPAWIGFLGGALISSKYTIKDIVDEYLEFRKKRRDLQKNPIHLLYELKSLGR